MPECKIAGFGESTMPLALVGLPIAAVLSLFDLQHSVTLFQTVLVVASITVAVLPSEDTISVVFIFLETAIVAVAVWIYDLSLTAELTILEVSLINSSILQC